MSGHRGFTESDRRERTPNAVTEGGGELQNDDTNKEITKAQQMALVLNQ